MKQREGKAREWVTVGDDVARAIVAGRKTSLRIPISSMPEPPAMDAIAPGHIAKHPAPYFDAYCGGRKTEGNPRGMTRTWCWWTRDERMGRDLAIGFQPGDRVAMRETWAAIWPGESPAPIEQCTIEYRADLPPGSDDGPGHWSAAERRRNPEVPRWQAARCMPRWAHRAELAIWDVKVLEIEPGIWAIEIHFATDLREPRP